MESDGFDDIVIEMRLARLENLMERRPILVNSVLLRQNPHNCNEWLKRVELLKEKPKEVCTFGYTIYLSLFIYLFFNVGYCSIY